MVAAIVEGNLDNAGLSAKERALLDYVKKVTEAAPRTTPQDVQQLRDAGWTEPQIAEAVYVTALFAFFKRVADAFGISPQGLLEMSATAPYVIAERMHMSAAWHKRLLRRSIVVLSACALLWVIGCAVLYFEMRRPPEEFARFMTRVPAPMAFMLF